MVMVGCLIAILARSCWHLAVAAVKLPALLCCDAMLSTVAFLTFPLRLLAAVDRERKLDRLVGEMQRQMERLVWENRELEEKLGMALKESRAMEEILDEMEEEHDDAFARITLLETQLKALKLENMRLIEHRGKSMWDKKPPATAVHGGESLPASTSRPSNTRKRKDREDEAEEAAAAQEEEGGGGVATEEDSEMSVQMRRGKAVARRRSLVSVGMAAAVGAVVWAADAPCLPLLAGLLATVGVSMCSVARFFLLLLRRRRSTQPQLVPPRRSHLPHAPRRRPRRLPARRPPRRPGRRLVLCHCATLKLAIPLVLYTSPVPVCYY
ncbi:uncharacterized protein LOC127759842 isoform X2 [Oryza glaberrima]|uniref:uncharacterized protein LOC127759842 isoform X2 n=1 Tax=Oryza glaberrima TaxID=4538 RepID=UPI00224BFE10|nr:uncharacterized protein LOC127759842 isoform X2 [Oryza glaberrima]